MWDWLTCLSSTCGRSGVLHVSEETLFSFQWNGSLSGRRSGLSSKRSTFGRDTTDLLASQSTYGYSTQTSPKRSALLCGLQVEPGKCYAIVTYQVFQALPHRCHLHVDNLGIGYEPDLASQNPCLFNIVLRLPEAILAVRTYAFLGKKPVLAVFFITLLVGEAAFLLYVSVAAVYQIDPFPIGDRTGPCTASDKPGKHIVSGFWLAPVAFDLICTFLTIWKVSF